MVRTFPKPYMFSRFAFKYCLCMRVSRLQCLFSPPGTGIIRLETRSEDCRTLIRDTSVYCCSGPCACYQTLGEPKWIVLLASAMMGQAKPYRCYNAAFACFISTTFPPHSTSQVRLILDVLGFEFGHLLCIIAHH